jgi:phospholipase C
VTYDEHGGFFDHVVPPATVHPGDSISEPGNNRNDFDFRQLGVRVPTILVSPFVAKGTIDHTTYDHTSILATIEKMFKLGSLTKRDGSAQSLNQLFKLKTPREDAPLVLPEPAFSGYVHKEKSHNSIESHLTMWLSELVSLFTREPVDPSLRGFHHVALLRDLQNSPETDKEKIARRFLRHKQAHAVRYMHHVKKKSTRHKVSA